MRSYVFTEKESILVKSFLKGEIGAKDRAFHVIVSRVKHFRRLAEDVDLYARLREAVATAST